MFRFVSAVLSLLLSSSIQFSHIGVDEGLSQGTVNTICQDSRGDLWLGTEYGLNRYDGTEIRVFTDKDGLPDNHIRRIHLDRDGRLWLCCGTYLAIYDQDSETFRNLALPSDQGEIYDFCFAPQGRIVAGCRYGMYCLEMSTGLLDGNFIPKALKKARVSAFRSYGDEVLMATRDFGRHLYRWNLESGMVKDEFIGPHRSNLNDVLQCGDSLWVATSADGLILRTPSGIRNFTIKEGLCSNSVRALLKDKSGRLWVGTFKGANVIEGGEITASFSKEDGFLSHNTVRSIFEDSPEGGIWLGNYYFGVDYYHPFNKVFCDTDNSLGDSSLRDELVSCLTYKDGELFVGVAGKGIWKYSSGRCIHYSLPNLPSGKDNTNDIKVIYPDPYNGKLYIGAHEGGFTEMNPRNGKSVLCTYREMMHPYAVEPWGRDSLVVGALGGLFVFDKSTHKCRRVDSQIRIKTIRTDADGNIWVGGVNGLAIFGAEDFRGMDLPEDLKKINSVHSIFRSSSHELYFLTDNGLYRFNPGNDELVHYDAETLLSDKSLSAMAEDSNGDLWVSSISGISRFNPETGQVRHWSSSDGIPCPQFSWNATVTLPDGRIFFGSHKGLVSFYPSAIVDNPYCADVHLDVLDVMGERLKSDGSSFKLQRGQDFLLLHFSAPNFASGEHTTYEYSVNGIWKHSDGHNVALSGLKPGKYHIEVLAVNSSGVKSAHITSVDAIVPFVNWYWIVPSLMFVLGSALLLTFRGRSSISEPDILPSAEASVLSVSEREFLERSDSIIKLNISNPGFTVESFAKQMCVSKSTLQHKMQTITGESALARIRRLRFEKACKLLEDNKLSISQISEETGFSSPSYFSTSFKEYVGCLPSEYVKRYLHKS